MEVWGAQVHLIPDAGHRVIEVHVIGEQRAARSAVGAADDPLIRAGNAAAAWKGLTECGAEANQIVRDAVERLFVRLWRWHVRRWTGEVGRGLGRRVIAPRADGEEIESERGADLFRNGFPAEIGRPLITERLDHAEHDEDGVDRLPAAGLVVEQAELRWKRIGFVDVGINAASVVLEEAAVLRRETCGEPLRGLAELEDALDPIMLDEVAAEDLGDFAGGHAAPHVHLPHAGPPRGIGPRGGPGALAGGGGVGG